MVVCNFFLKGTCKFGNRCRNEHPADKGGAGGSGGGLFSGGGGGGSGFGGNNNSGGNVFGRARFGQNANDQYHFSASSNKTSIFGSSNNNSSNALSHSGGLFGAKSNVPSGGLFGSPQNNKTTAQSYEVILQLVRKELQEWDVNQVWPLSCFAAQKEQKCLPGLTDTSPEELRFEAYKCKATGQMQPYLEGLAMLSEITMKQRAQLKAFNNQQLINEINNATVPQANQSTGGGLFSTTSTTNTSGGLFGSNSNQQGGLFGNTASAGGVGGGLFGSAPKITNTVSPFGASNTTTGLFSNSGTSQSTGLFGASGGSNQSTGLFGSSSNTAAAAQNPFGGAGGSGVQNPFVNKAQTTGGLFGNSTTQNNTGGGLFSSNATSGGMFGSANQTGGLFGTSNNQQQQQQSSGGLFSQNKGTSLFGNSNAQSGGGLFSSNNAQMSNATSGGGLFSSAAKPAGGGLFSSTTTATNNQGSGGLFSSNNATGGATTGLFAQNQQSSGLFSNASQVAATTQQTSAPSTQSAPSNPFLSQAQKNKLTEQQQMFDQLNKQQVTVAPAKSSGIIVIPPVTPADMEKFKSDRFVLGEIPMCPPPPEMCA